MQDKSIPPEQSVPSTRESLQTINKGGHVLASCLPTQLVAIQIKAALQMYHIYPYRVG